MRHITYLTPQDVVEINRRLCLRDNNPHHCYGIGKVESALHSTYYPGEPPYQHGGIVSVAAAMAYYLNQAHAFVDGNKRTAMTSALVFMNENGWTLDYPREPVDTLAELIEGCAAGEIGMDEMKEWFESNKTQLH